MSLRSLLLVLATATPVVRLSDDSCSKDSCPPTMSVNERTFICVKPDGVQRNLVGKIIARFEERGYKLVALKMMSASKAHLEVRPS
ncbi:unnamed protein product [Cylicostephanus goldi]|uniref:nucleoside-diphosphate kinase n=1 Tax=Cylicostephanus goldi TaxID=71465 RepID=A0A3P7QQ13_CYLGO|nr:unnamed protein product [Cylicostephanus goldi]